MTRTELIQMAMADFVAREPRVAMWCLVSASVTTRVPWKLDAEVKQSTGLPEESEGPHWMPVTTERIEPVNGDTRVAVILTSWCGPRRDRRWWYNLDLTRSLSHTEKPPVVPSVHYYDHEDVPEDNDDAGQRIDPDARAERRQMGIT